MKHIIFTPTAPAAIGPYSQAVSIGNTLYLSGQIGINPATGMLADGVAAQTRQALENVKEVLAAAGMGFEQVVKTTVFISSMDYFSTVNGVYQSYFTHEPPARSCVAVASLPKNALVEIECIAVKE